MKDIFDGPERVKIRSSSVLDAIKVSASYLIKSCGALLTRWLAVTKLSQTMNAKCGLYWMDFHPCSYQRLNKSIQKKHITHLTKEHKHEENHN